jgi:hypothetical protein
MRIVLLAAAGALAAIPVLPTASADARNLTGTGIPNAKTPQAFGAQPSFVGVGSRHGRFRHGDRDRHNVRTHRGFDDDAVVDGGIWSYGGEWALYNNRSWEADSYNDWWHDRPDRAYPRWVQQNANCTPDRMWWSGSGWHC